MLLLRTRSCWVKHSWPPGGAMKWDLSKRGLGKDVFLTLHLPWPRRTWAVIGAQWTCGHLHSYSPDMFFGSLILKWDCQNPLLCSFVLVALRKIETSHHLSIDKSHQHTEIFQKPSLSIDIPQKPQPGDLPPKPLPLELTQKPQVGDLPPKPGELPPKPQLGDLPPKPQLGDLPPKPQMKDLPPKPQLGELLAKTQGGEASLKPQPSEANQKSHSLDLSPSVQSRDTVQRQPSEESNDITHTLPETPVPLPRKINMVGIIPYRSEYPWWSLKLL